MRSQKFEIYMNVFNDSNYLWKSLWIVLKDTPKNSLMLHWTTNTHTRCILKSFLTVNMVWNKLFILSHYSSNLLFMYLKVFQGHSIPQQKFQKILKIWMYSLKVMTKNYFKVKTRLQNHWNRHQSWKLFRALLDLDNWIWCVYGYIVPCFSKSCSPKRFLRVCVCVFF